MCILPISRTLPRFCKRTQRLPLGAAILACVVSPSLYKLSGWIALPQTRKFSALRGHGERRFEEIGHAELLGAPRSYRPDVGRSRSLGTNAAPAASAESLPEGCEHSCQSGRRLQRPWRRCLSDESAPLRP